MLTLNSIIGTGRRVGTIGSLQPDHVVIDWLDNRSTPVDREEVEDKIARGEWKLY